MKLVQLVVPIAATAAVIVALNFLIPATDPLGRTLGYYFSFYKSEVIFLAFVMTFAISIVHRSIYFSVSILLPFYMGVYFCSRLIRAGLESGVPDWFWTPSGIRMLISHSIIDGGILAIASIVVFLLSRFFYWILRI